MIGIDAVAALTAGTAISGRNDHRHSVPERDRPPDFRHPIDGLIVRPAIFDARRSGPLQIRLRSDPAEMH